MWWTKDNIRPNNCFQVRVSLPKKLWFSVENNRIPFLMGEIAEWCRDNGIDWYLDKEPANLDHWLATTKYCQAYFLNKNIKTQEEKNKIITARLDHLDHYNVVATFRNVDDGALFKLTWC